MDGRLWRLFRNSCTRAPTPAIKTRSNERSRRQCKWIWPAAEMLQSFAQRSSSTSMILVPKFQGRPPRFAHQALSGSWMRKSSAPLKPSDKCWLSYPQRELYGLLLSVVVCGERRTALRATNDCAYMFVSPFVS